MSLCSASVEMASKASFVILISGLTSVRMSVIFLFMGALGMMVPVLFCSLIISLSALSLFLLLLLLTIFFCTVGAAASIYLHFVLTYTPIALVDV